MDVRGVLGPGVSLRILRAQPLPARLATLSRYVPVLLGMAAVLLVHGATIAHALVLTDAGAQDQLSIGILAPCASAWLIWDRRGRLAAVALRPWWPALLAVAFASAAWALGALVGINLLCQLSVVALLPALAAAIMGRAAARILLFPLLFLLFTVDVYSLLIPVLMELTAHLGVAALQATGVPATLAGLTINAPFGRWQVIEGCSGLDYLLIYAMAATLFAAAAFRALLARVAYVGAAVLAAILANGLRAWAIVYVAYLRGGFDDGHDLIGWLAFALGFALLFALGFRLSRSRHGAVCIGDLGAAGPQGPVPLRPDAGEFRAGLRAALAALVLVAAAPAALAALDRAAAQAPQTACTLVAAGVADAPGAVLHYRAACGGPAGAGRSLDLAKTLLRDAAPDAVLVSGRREVLVPGEGAGPGRKIEAATLTTLPTPAEPVSRRLTYWYEVGPEGRSTYVSSRLGLKWSLARERLAGRDGRVIVFAELETLNSAAGWAH